MKLAEMPITPMSSFTSIPIVNISGLFSDKFEDRYKVATELGEAARTVGFVVISDHGISPEIISGVKDAAREFFAQSMDHKMECYIGKSQTHKGYVPEGAEIMPDNSTGPPDHKEAFDMGIECDIQTSPLVGPNTWPSNIPGFRERAQKYYAAVFELGRKLSSAFALALGLPETYFDSLITRPPVSLRMVHYPFDTNVYDAPGMGAHTDYQCFTMLLADEPGLEVLNGAGEWIDAPPIPGTFVVNIGDMLETMTAGQFLATKHRVRRVQQERYSFPMFYSCDYDVEMKPLPQFQQQSENSMSREYSPISGQHVWAQLIHTYKYLAERANRGEIEIPADAVEAGSFGVIKV